MTGKKRTSALAVNAVLTAVCVALNFAASLHIVRLDVVFYLLAGSLVYFAAVRFGAGTGGVLYAASAILSFLLVPDKVWLLFFIGVFGPASVFQAVLEKGRSGKAASGQRTRKWLTALLTAVVFVVLFYVFGVAVAYGGGFIPLIGLPEAGVPGNLILAMGFAVFSAVISYIVNCGLYEMLSRRLRGVMQEGAAVYGAQKATGFDTMSENKKGSAKAGSQGGIVIPKLYDDED